MRCDSQSPALLRIPVRTAGLLDRRFHLLPLGSVLYFFAGGAAHGELAIPGYAPEVFRPGKIYARTRTVVYATCFSTLEALTAYLDPARFRRAHRSVVVNLRRIEMFDPGRGARRVGFRSARVPIEWVPVGDSFVRRLSESLGMPGRRPRSRSAPLASPGLAAVCSGPTGAVGGQPCQPEPVAATGR